jgi:hypothetical protein
LERRSCGSTLEVEERGSVGTQGAECSGDQKAKLFFAQATCNVGGAETKNKVEELLAELADLGIARDGERSERIVAEENGAAAADVSEFGSKGTSGARYFILQEKHGMELDSRLGHA